MESQPSEHIFFRLLQNFYMNLVSVFFYASFASLPPCRVCLSEGRLAQGYHQGEHAARRYREQQALLLVRLYCPLGQFGQVLCA